MKLSLKELINKVNDALQNSDKNIPKNGDNRIKDTVSERRVRSYISGKLLHKPFRTDGEIWYDESHVEKLIAIRNLQGSGMSENAIKSVSRLYGEDDLSKTVVSASASNGLNFTESFFDDVKTGAGFADISACAQTDNVNNLLSSDLFKNLTSTEGTLADYVSTPNIATNSTDTGSVPSTDIEQRKNAIKNYLQGIQGEKKNLGSSIQGAISPLDKSPITIGTTVTGGFDLSKSGRIEASPARGLVEPRSYDVNTLGSALTAVSKNPVKSIQEYELDENGKVFLRIEDGAKVSNPRAVLEKIKQILNIKE